MERSGIEVGKGTTDEDRGRCIKEKGENKGGGRLMETESGSLPLQFSLAVILAVINEEWNSICFPWEFLLSRLRDCPS